MSDLNPHDLINLPGAGRAEEAVRKAGAWDEGIAPDAVDWRVTVYATVTVTQEVSVRAATEAIAKRLGTIAAESAQGNWEWDRSLFIPSVNGVDASTCPISTGA